tara:strand:- start:242 stop:814 length:573 start_codon:yes stop_codon:yes gene_type:complete
MGAEIFIPLAVGALGAGGAAADRKQNKKALSAQQAQNDSNAKFLAKQTAKAEGQVKSLFETSQGNQQEGFRRALDILGQTIPQQLSTFQQGNVGAQEQLLAGLPQIQNALLGRQVDLSGLQPKQVQFDPSFAQQQIPHFQTSGQALNRAAAPAQVMAQNAGLLGGMTVPDGQSGQFGMDGFNIGLLKGVI